MTLPVFEIADDLRAAVAAGDRSRVLLKAPTGSGKSTSVPGMLLDAGISGRILVIEPRRMAARLLAGWVAKQRKATLGNEVGYAVRFDTKYRHETRIIYLTDGVFQRWIQDDPTLSDVGAVVFDEFHERRLAVDVALARCLDLQEGPRPDLRVVVMSATLETAGLADYLAPAVSLEAGGRTHPVQVLYRADRPPVNDRRGGPPRETPIWEKMVNVCREAMAMPDPGNILMFLPGTHEIRRTIELLENTIAKGWDVFPLYSALQPAAQEAAISRGPRPKIIVATNVAETSLTIDGVRTVIDSGLARIASFDPRRGINTLLIGFCQEVGIRSVLTTEVIYWASSSVKECALARALAWHAVTHRTLPKHVEPRLITLRSGRPQAHGPEVLDQLAAAIRDPNFRVFAEGNLIHLVGAGIHLESRDPFALFDDLQATGQTDVDASHAFYLGYEMAKAVTALTLGKDYRQDQALDWGHLTRPEIAHGPSRAAARVAAQAGSRETVDAPEPSSQEPSPAP